MDITKIKTLGDLKKSGYKSRTIKEEIRENLMVKIKAKETTFPGIVGYEETVIPDELQAAIVTNLQRVRVDDDDVIDEMGSLSQSAEALRLTAAAPPRNQNLGGDSDA